MKPRGHTRAEWATIASRLHMQPAQLRTLYRRKQRTRRRRRKQRQQKRGW